MANIGVNIKKRREELGLTQEALAARLGYKSKSSINKIELGINDLPQKKIMQFAAALNTTPGVLMGWVSEETDKKNDEIVNLVKRFRVDPDFLDVVSILDKMPEDEYNSFKTLILSRRK